MPEKWEIDFELLGFYRPALNCPDYIEKERLDFSFKPNGMKHTKPVVITNKKADTNP